MLSIHPASIRSNTRVGEAVEGHAVASEVVAATHAQRAGGAGPRAGGGRQQQQQRHQHHATLPGHTTTFCLF